MGKVYQELLESFGYLTEAPGDSFVSDKPAGDPSAMAPGEIRYAPGYDPNAKPDTTNAPADQEPKKSDPTKNPLYDPYIVQVQKLFNDLGITDDSGNKLALDGVWGKRSEAAKNKFFAKYPQGSKESNQYDALASKVNPKLQWKVIPDKKKSGTAAQPGAAASSPQIKSMSDSVARLEALLKKYNIQAECALNKDGSLLTEDDWVLKHIDMFTEQEKMEIWKIISEAPLSSFGTVGDEIAARRQAGEVGRAYKASTQAGANYNAGATATAQNMPQQQSKLSKFGRSLGSKFGMGGGKRAALKGAAKLGLRAIPFIGTAALLWDIGSALYDTFASTEIADMTPEDQQIIAKEIKAITDFSKSADYNNAPEDLKKRITAVLNAANNLAQQEA